MSLTIKQYKKLRDRMQVERALYLESVHTPEDDVHVFSVKGHSHCNREYFKMDGFRIWMPLYFQYVTEYKKYLILRGLSPDVSFIIDL